MIVIVCGGREYGDAVSLNAALDALHSRKPISTLIEGGAKGADSLAGAWASSRGVYRVTVHANWEKHGKGAGPRRNSQMMTFGSYLACDAQCDLGVVAFPGGSGTADMKRQAKAAGLTVWEPIK